MLRRFFLFIGLFLISMTSYAQFDVLDFRWNIANLSFSYPATWDEPYAVQQFGVETMILAESDSRNPERAPDIPFITMTLQSTSDIDADRWRQQQLNEININQDVSLPILALDQTGTWVSGNSRDDEFFGIGVSIVRGEQILTIIGRTPVEQTTQFEATFTTLLRSLTPNQTSGDTIPFGLVWSTLASNQDGERAFTSLANIKLDQANQSLYAIDDNLGLLQFDMLSGRLQTITPNPDFSIPTEIAITTDQTLYIGDIGCQCIHVYQNGTWQEPLLGFAEGAPLSLVALSDGSLYATDIQNFEYVIQQYATNTETGLLEQTTLPISVPLDDQPILFTQGDQLYFLDVTIGDIFQWQGSDFVSLHALDLLSPPMNVQVAPDGTYLIANTATIDFYTPDNFIINSLSISDYSPGSALRGMALADDGTLYTAIIGNNSAEILALSQQVPDTRYGLPMLAPYRISGGILSDNDTEDIWFLRGNRNDRINLFVQGYPMTENFDFNVTLFDPNDEELLHIDEDQSGLPFDNRSLQNFLLPSDGVYRVHIQHVSGQGNYEIVPVTPQSIMLNPDTTTRWGELTESHYKDVWSFEGDGRTNVSIAVEVDDPTQFDATLTVYDSQYRQIAMDTDSGSAVGYTAQIQDFMLPRNGVYYVEVAKVIDFGKYSITIDVTEPDS